MHLMCRMSSVLAGNGLITRWVMLCSSDMVMGAAELLISSVVLPYASRRQSLQRSKLSVSVDDAQVAVAEWQTAAADSTVGSGGPSTTSATSSAVSPVRAMLTGEGTVPQVSELLLLVHHDSSRCLCMKVLDNTVNSCTPLSNILLPLQSLLQQLSPQLLCLLQQLLGPNEWQLSGGRSEPGKVVGAAVSACWPGRPGIALHFGLNTWGVYRRIIVCCERTCVLHCC